MTLKQTNKRGFTIVELLIVIVVIAILAAITIVAYNGITTRANASASKGNATTLQKKIETFIQVNNGTPPVAATSLATQLNGVTESTITGTGIVVTAAGADPTATNGKYTFRVKYCSAPALATGFEIGYYDYTASNIATITGGGNTTACTTYGTNATP
ncbi:MAG TPA: prepilin-type N-terminal cleavage/methylation domain-containing protein [Candidatus Saccharimonas sp.]|jgi:prepilin-type N-terminal cleavage/methylation domain-containing protein|nr:prepilin-type N-terminal cleavage/methylation domain-containing protein [Candidatus Saccharimonas sp.]